MSGQNRFLKTRPLNTLTIDSQNSKVPFHGSSQPTTAMSINNKSEQNSKVFEMTRVNLIQSIKNSNSPGDDYVQSAGGPRQIPQSVVPEIFSDEQLINVDLSSPAFDGQIRRPNRFRARTRNKEEPIDPKQANTHQVMHFEDQSQLHGSSMVSYVRTVQSRQGAQSNNRNSRLIIKGNSAAGRYQSTSTNEGTINVPNYQKKEETVDTMDIFLKDFYNQNHGKAPQVIIDRLRKHIDQTKQEGERMRQKIQEYDKTNESIRRQTKELKDKSHQAISDKYEIMRDLATYEHNYSLLESESSGMDLRQRLLKSISMIKEAQLECKKTMTMAELDQLRKTDQQQSELSQLEQDYMKSESEKADQSHAGQGFEAEKNYLLSLIASLENYQIQRKALDRNRLPLLEEKSEPDLDLELSAVVTSLSKDQMDITNRRGSKQAGSNHGSRSAIEKMKSRRNLRLIKLMNRANVASMPDQRTPRIDPDTTKSEILNQTDFYIMKSSKKSASAYRKRMKMEEEKGDKNTSKNPCLAINSAFSPDEQLYCRIVISGLDCLIQALFHNGLIKGQVSVAATSEQLKFDLNPVLNERFHAVSISTECKRIYFDVTCDPQGNLHLKLLTKNKAQYLSDKENNKRNFIVRLNGSRNSKSSLEITNDTSNKEFTLQTKIFHTLNLKQQEIFDIKNQVVSQKYTYAQMVELLKPKYKISEAQLESVSLRLIAKQVEKEMCIYQKQDRQYTFIQLSKASSVTEAQDTFTKQYTNQRTANKMLRSRNGGVQGFSDLPAFLGQGAGRVNTSQEKHGPGASAGKENFASDRNSNPKEMHSFEVEKRRSMSKATSPIIQSLINFPDNKDVNDIAEKLEEKVEALVTADDFDEERIRRNMLVQRVARIKNAKWQERCLIDKLQLEQLRKVRSTSQLTEGFNTKNDLSTGGIGGFIHQTVRQPHQGNALGSFQIVEEQLGTASLKPEQGQQPQMFYLKRSLTETNLELVENFRRQYVKVDIAQIKQQQKQIKQTMMQNNQMNVPNLTQHDIIDATDYHVYLLDAYERDRVIRQDMRQLSTLDKFMDFYILYYGKRLINSQKRFKIVANQKQKQRKLEVERIKDQVMIYQEYNMGLKDQFENCKNRERDQSSYSKRKYHRLAKIYQKNFIQLLYDSKKVIHQYDEFDPDNPAFKILFLFFQIRNQFCLLLGRDKAEGGDDDEYEESSQSDRISKTSSQQNKLIEVDDDSPYFLRITINPQFMFLLDDTNLPLTSEDIADACKESLIGIFRENRIFKDIVRREVQQMFKEKKLIDLQTGIANAVAGQVNAIEQKKKEDAVMPTVTSLQSPEQNSSPDQVSKDITLPLARKSIVPEKINEESEGTQTGRDRINQTQDNQKVPEQPRKTLDNSMTQPFSQQASIMQAQKDLRIESQKDSQVFDGNRAEISGIAESIGDKKLNEAGKRLTIDYKLPNEVRVSFDESNLNKDIKTQKRIETYPDDSPNALHLPPHIETQSSGSPLMDKEKEEELFEQAMGNVVGNFSIVLNFNS